MTDLGRLLRPDGSVVVPPGLAGEVLRYLARALVEEARANGSQPSPAARALLSALYAAGQPVEASTDPVPLPAGTASVAEVADHMGCSTRWVRHLLATGQLHGRKAGGVWLVLLPNAEASQRAA
jgi:hypothetical protein